MACDNIPHNYSKSKTGTPSEAITKAYREVGALIHSRASANRDFQGMGTTCSTLLLLPDGVLIAHVGDSRVYRIRNPRIDQLSFDHSLVWELVRRNHLTPEHANLAVPKNVITRSLGPDPSVEVDIEGPLAVEPNDAFLLCSDGLSGPVTDPELGAFAAHFHPQDACRYLVNLANLRGGHDNITVLVLRVGDWVEPDSELDPAAPGGTRRRVAAGRPSSGSRRWASSSGRRPRPGPRSRTIPIARPSVRSAWS
jgi:protein phosphatase